MDYALRVYLTADRRFTPVVVAGRRVIDDMTTYDTAEGAMLAAIEIAEEEVGVR